MARAGNHCRPSCSMLFVWLVAAAAVAAGVCDTSQSQASRSDSVDSSQSFNESFNTVPVLEDGSESRSSRKLEVDFEIICRRCRRNGCFKEITAENKKKCKKWDCKNKKTCDGYQKPTRALPQAKDTVVVDIPHQTRLPPGDIAVICLRCRRNGCFKEITLENRKKCRNWDCQKKETCDGYKKLSKEDDESSPLAFPPGKEEHASTPEWTVNYDPACGGSTEFSAHVLVEHSLLDSDDIDRDLMELLERAFMDTYNTLNAPSTTRDICDKDLLRVVEAVQVAGKDTIYKKLDGQKLERKNFLYRVKGRCNGCGPDTKLFEVANHRPEDTISGIMDDIKPTSCVCDPSEIRSPTDVEFRDAFRKRIKELEASGDLSNIKSSDHVVEYVIQDCNWEQNTFLTDVELDWNEVPDTENYDAITDDFLNSYNHLTTAYCDPYYRFVSDVSVEEIEESNSDVGSRLLDVVKKRKKKKRLGFKVKGRCKGCKRKSGLFNDKKPKMTTPEDERTRRNLRSTYQEGNLINSVVRQQDQGHHMSYSPEPLSKISHPGFNKENKRELFTAKYFDLRHVYNGNDACFCAANPVARRAPSESEFVASYNQALLAGNDKGYISQRIMVNKKTKREMTEEAPEDPGISRWRS